MDAGRTTSQPRVVVAEIADPADANAGIESIDLDAVQLQAAPFEARRIAVRLEETSLLFHSATTRLRTRTHALEDVLAYVAFGPRTRGTADGLLVRQNMLLAIEPGAEISFVTESGWESVTVMLAAADLRAHLEARGRAREFHAPKGVEVLRASPGGARQLFAVGKRLATTAGRHPARFEGRSHRSAAEVELIEALLAALSTADEFEPDRADRTRQAYARTVKRVEAFVLGRTADHLSITDLCKVAAVSERTLQTAFKEVMGLTPLAYLTRVRLNRVHQALLAAVPSTTKVSSEAVKWGFWHFGEFARAYRTCFGEAPSATLRRRSSDARELPRD
jgi:AraC family ethanolamine operon transcriptional activator